MKSWLPQLLGLKFRCHDTGKLRVDFTNQKFLGHKHCSNKIETSKKTNVFFLQTKMLTCFPSSPQKAHHAAVPEERTCTHELSALEEPHNPWHPHLSPPHRKCSHPSLWCSMLGRFCCCLLSAMLNRTETSKWTLIDQLCREFVFPKTKQHYECRFVFIQRSCHCTGSCQEYTTVCIADFYLLKIACIQCINRFYAHFSFEQQEKGFYPLAMFLCKKSVSGNQSDWRLPSFLFSTDLQIAS